MSNKLTTLSQLQSGLDAVLNKVKNKGYAVAATTLAGYGIQDAYTKTEIDAKIASTYRPAGTIAGSELVSALLVAGNVGKVYNISSELAITAANEGMFKNLSAGDKVKVGDDVGVIAEEVEEGGETTTVYLFNDFAGFVDLSGVTYTNGNGLNLVGQEFSVKIDSSNANGLGVTSDGLKLDTVSASTSGVGGSAGAMTAAQAEKLAGLENTTSGDGIDITNHEASVVIDSSNANGLSVGQDGVALALAAADTWGGVAATGTAQAGVDYYTSAACTTLAEVSVGDDVSSLYVKAKTADGTNGAMTSAEKYKLSQIEIATTAEVETMIAGLVSL